MLDQLSPLLITLLLGPFWMNGWSCSARVQVPGEYLAQAAASAAEERREPAKPAYPRSRVAQGIALDWATHKRAAQGSDNVQLSWAADGHLYGAWGDGGDGNGRHRSSSFHTVPRTTWLPTSEGGW